MKELKIQSTLKSIQSSLLNYTVKSLALSKHTKESLNKLERYVLDAQAKIEVLKLLCPSHEKLPDFELRVAVFLKECKNRENALNVTSKASTKLSKSASVSHPKNKSQLELELDCLNKQAEANQKLFEIQCKLRMKNLIEKQKEIQSKLKFFAGKRAEVELPNNDVNACHVTSPNRKLDIVENQSEKHTQAACETENFPHGCINKDDKADVVTVKTADFICNDGLASFKIAGEALSEVPQALNVCAVGNIGIRKSTKDDFQVVDAIPMYGLANSKNNRDLQSQCQVNTQFNENTLIVDRCFMNGKFTFTADLKEQTITRFHKSSTAASVLDQFGLLLPETLKDKCILQQVYRIKAGWNYDFEPQPEQRWYKCAWRQDLYMLAILATPWSLKSANLCVVDVKLSHWSDASNYSIEPWNLVRKINRHGDGHYTNFPAMDAALPLRTLKSVKSEMKSNVSRGYVKCEPKSILGYTQDGDLRMRFHVADRMQQFIRNCTPSQQQWKYTFANNTSVEIVSNSDKITKLLSVPQFDVPSPKYFNDVYDARMKLLIWLQQASFQHDKTTSKDDLVRRFNLQSQH